MATALHVSSHLCGTHEADNLTNLLENKLGSLSIEPLISAQLLKAITFYYAAASPVNLAETQRSNERSLTGRLRSEYSHLIRLSTRQLVVLRRWRIPSVLQESQNEVTNGDKTKISGVIMDLLFLTGSDRFLVAMQRWRPHQHHGIRERNEVEKDDERTSCFRSEK